MNINVRYLKMDRMDGNTSIQAVSSNNNVEGDLARFVILLAETTARLDQRGRNFSANTIEVSI